MEHVTIWFCKHGVESNMFHYEEVGGEFDSFTASLVIV